MQVDPGKVEVLLYDFGGVIIEISFERVFERWAKLSGLPVEHVKSHFQHGDAYNAHEKGQLGTHDFYDVVRKDIGLALDDAQMRDGWMQVLGDEIAPTVANIARIGERMPQYLFSNTNEEHYEVWGARHARALAPMKKQFISSDMGVRKPDAEAFEAVARHLGVPLDRILFLDDTEKNVAGARAVGMQAVLVRSPEDATVALRSWL